ncbi:hypothetical protein [Pantoea dispersa]|uniref:hypothetical protein n=1 Tax=Pantoea dispersa TaxID=59814 RepID=UPI000736F1D2|nr:hypothetical protein [Pantoea dispersa]KTS31444.1 hypothetical protein NS389_20535 [Pantoea dispersa]KTS60863.1 hypothetical protein NS380_04050 [Pantoea dispersa]
MTDAHPIWLQGHVLTDADSTELGYRKEDDHLTKVVVISHDCDIQSPSDASIEIIVGKLVKSNSQFTNAKHPRIIHLRYENQNGTELNAIELKHVNRSIVKKDDFKVHNPCDNYPIDSDEKRALKQWLAAKYGRPAFPDEFEKRIRAFDDRKKKIRFENEVAEILRVHSEHLLGLYFDLGENRFIDLPEQEPYELSIYAVFDSEKGWTDAEQDTRELCQKLRERFEFYYGTPDRAQMISLENCEAISDSEFTLSQIRKMDHWRVEYISLEDDFSGDFIGAAH